MKKICIFGREIIDPKAIQQIKNCVGPEDIAVLTADAHYGYGLPIGSAVAYKDHISEAGCRKDKMDERKRRSQAACNSF